MCNIIAETERLIIREFRLSDAIHLYNCHKEEAVVKWFPNEVYDDIEDAEDAISFFTQFYSKQEDPYVLAVVLKETNEYIGDTGFNEVDGYDGEYELGYVIKSKYYNKGYATEVVNCVKEYFTRKFKIKSIQGRVVKGNEASVRVLEKNGFSFQEIAMNQEDDPYGNGMLVYVWNTDF